MAGVATALKWHGGKSDLARWIISLMPPRCKNPNKPDATDLGWLHYVEPYFGGGTVLLALDPKGVSEVVNDINGDLTNFWTVLANRELFDHMRRLLEATPFSEPEWSAAQAGLNGEHREGSFDSNGGISVVRAAWFFIHCRQSLAGRMDCFAPLTRNRARRGMNEQASAWLSAVDRLPTLHGRLRRVVVYNRDALDVIRKEDGLRTLFYLDPPYLHETRATTGEYEHEMTPLDHANLLVTLGGVKASVLTNCTNDRPGWWSTAKPIKGRFMLSGYHSQMYDSVAMHCGWNCHEKAINNHAAGGKTKRVMTECVYCNF